MEDEKATHRSEARCCRLGLVEGRARPEAYRSEEEETDNGPADYALWLDDQVAGVVEAKKLPEQHRIVEQVEALLTEVGRAKDRLDRVKVILKRFRQAVLAAACAGKLTNGNDEFAPVALEALLAEPMANGRSVPDASSGFPVLRLTALKGGRIDLAERKIGAWSANEADRFRVKRGDFMISRGNGSLSLVGRGGLIDVDPDAVAYPDTMIRVRPNQDRLVPEYLRLCWQAPEIRGQIEAVAHTTAGIHKVSQKDLAGIELPLPRLITQHQIVRIVQKMFAIADTIEARLVTASTRAEKLPQAILSKAFRGELVPTEAELARAEGRSFASAEEMLQRVISVSDGAAVKTRRRSRGSASPVAKE